MKLVREASNCNQDYMKDFNMRGKHCFRIVGNEDEAKLIEAIDNAIGSEIYGANGSCKDITWKQECSDDCADYVWGSGCGWIVDKDDVEDFKALWKKHKKLAKNFK